MTYLIEPTYFDLLATLLDRDEDGEGGVPVSLIRNETGLTKRIYSVLERAERRGWVERSSWTEIEGGRRWDVHWRITELGEAALDYGLAERGEAA